jgi:Ca2+-binding EF-hand superfamily protein
MIKLPGTHLQLTASTSAKNFTNCQDQAKAYMRYDADKNGYLEKSEMNNHSFLTRLFRQADEDGNQMVFVDELEKYFQRGIELHMNRISAAALDLGNSLFDALDANGDRWLGAREIQTATERLNGVDKNGDKAITIEEMPTTIHVALSRGSYSAEAINNLRKPSGAVVRFRLRNRSAKKPRWFIHMDRNGDGDVSIREFLGTREQFDRLDKNDDGFIAAKETESDAKSP